MKSYKVPLTEQHRGGPFCDHCGEEIRWKKLKSGRWIAVEKEPVLYRAHAGKSWLVEGLNFGRAELLRDCQIWKPGMPTGNTLKGYKPHAWECWGNR